MRTATAPDIGRHVVGNALVLHSGESISHEAQSLALAVDPDTDNDIVVLDLQGDVPVRVWESVARSIERSRRGIRLVICGARSGVTMFAGQWLSDRLKRTVVAPHGHLIRGTAGSLFVHDDAGGGWIRHRPRKSPVWESKRYPSPPWDAAAAEFHETSAVGAAEPLPGGVWIRDSQDEDATSRHWSWLSSSLPCQPDALTVVVGCPGTPPLPLDDLNRFWRRLPADDQRRVRFVHYGPVRMPAGAVLGQVLADLFRAPVACFTGIPIGRPDRPQMHTAALHGGLGWQVFARELGFLPSVDGVAPQPQILSYRAPKVFGPPVEPMVYQYAKDAVVEIVQSGLWVRAPQAPPDAARVRDRVPDPTAHALIYDDTNPVTAPRMRALSEDLVARLDPATRTLSTLLPASHLIAASAAQESLGAGEIDFRQTSVFTAADLGLPAEVLRAAAPPTVAPPLPDVPVLRRSAPGLAGGQLDPEEPIREPGQFIVAGEETPDPPVPAPPAPDPWFAETVLTASDWLTPMPIGQQPVPIAEAMAVAVEPVSPSPLPPVTSAPPSLPKRVPGNTWLSDEGKRLLLPEPPADPFRPTPALVNAWSSYRRNAAGTGPAVLDLPEPAPRRRTIERQSTPDPEARGLPTGDGSADERAWLRRTFAREFDAAAAPVARILAEHPRLADGDPAEATGDAVAVRLYLSAAGDGLDKELRSGTLGGHVPFARCVAAGLSRLPAHRGACLLHAAVDQAELGTFTAGDELTDWSFVNAVTGPVPDLPGVEVWIWAMSARRTRVLEPDSAYGVDGRVVFLPGTPFKVLAVDPDRLLLREMSPDENPAARTPFDDLALKALRQCAERWTAGNPYAEVGPAAVERFAALPGTL